MAVANGATAIDDPNALCDQGDLFWPVASTTTAWRCLDEISAVQRGRIDRARARGRVWVWPDHGPVRPDPLRQNVLR
jgi:hypothetical protein